MVGVGISLTRVEALLALAPAEWTDTDLPAPFGRFGACRDALGVVLVDEAGEVPFGVP